MTTILTFAILSKIGWTLVLSFENGGSVMEVEQKVVLITGASSGIGKAVALALSHKHNRIVITARRKELLSQVANDIQKNGSEALAIDGDALDEEQAASVVHDAVSRFGRIDIALLNIGTGPSLNTATACPDDIKQNMRLNYDSMVNFFCPVVRQMKTQDSGGIIANTNSLAGFLGLPTQGQYSAAKAACRIFLDTARIELKQFNIGVIAICPGFVITERNKQRRIPRSLTLSTDKAAQHILKALKSEAREYLFPASLKAAVVVGRVLPHFLQDKILSRMASYS
ncbi:MAG: SDR family NAD(P)-dependent oxidoreductase [Dehalococcoidia bacterium]|nr:SDR family NAD(P)-dependent oxidoreductase [Dehalococcoidia bacterium]